MHPGLIFVVAWLVGCVATAFVAGLANDMDESDMFAAAMVCILLWPIYLLTLACGWALRRGRRARGAE